MGGGGAGLPWVSTSCSISRAELRLSSMGHGWGVGVPTGPGPCPGMVTSPLMDSYAKQHQPLPSPCGSGPAQSKEGLDVRLLPGAGMGVQRGSVVPHPLTLPCWALVSVL